MASMAEKAGLVLLGGVLGTGAFIGISELRNSTDNGTKPKPEAVKKGYSEVDSDNYWIHASGPKFDHIDFGNNLAQFRNEVSGDFIVIPYNAKYPLSYRAFATRKTQLSADGQPNTIQFVTGSSSK